MVKCTFCGDVLKKGTGLMYVEKDGNILYFCTHKCEKNTLKLKRRPIDTKWSGRWIGRTEK